MPDPLETFKKQINWTRYHSQLRGHYESQPSDTPTCFLDSLHDF